uniref:tRNA pseudouridine synthase B n=1 Tax=Candidatus Aschnera chinzeii TaxID=1485666 RepID=A0AAT9G3Q4_9ENTR|nr:MAG: tRNA pseudouridine(55) synthase TruB [Candidatus Aschnera chinzeii]
MKYCSNLEKHGVLLLDKPTNFSSNNVLQKVRHLLNNKTAGYVGTLDPLASGMLPICLGKATKFSQFLSDSDKRYHVIARLGQRTDTMDAYGKIIEINTIKVTQKTLYEILNKFHGSVVQIPPMYSAIKYYGKPLYQYARSGIDVERACRKIYIYDLKCKNWHNNLLELEIHCSKGTYIRVIIDDIGKLLGCGAHVIYLRRLQMANYSSDHMISLEYLNTLYKENNLYQNFLDKKIQTFLLPIESMVSMYDTINIDQHTAKCFKHGQAINIKHKFNYGQKIRVTENNFKKFIGIAEIDKLFRIKPLRLIRF